jgi:hypothetical protein
MENIEMYLLLGLSAAGFLLFAYKQFFEVNVINLPKTNIELLQELIKIMNKLMENAQIDKAKFSQYLKYHDINLLKLWDTVKQQNLNLDLQTQLSLFGDEFTKIITEFLSSGGFF